MAERKMTELGFIKKAGGKVSATAFMRQHREFLTTGTLAQFTSPILDSFDNGEILPTPALEQLKSVVWDHYAASQLLKAEKSLTKAMAPKSEKPYVVSILDEKGNICTRLNEEGEEVELRQGFATDGEAHGWADRRLFEGASDWHATIAATKLRGKDGGILMVHILRDDAIARLLRAPKQASMRKVGGATSGKLGFGVKAVGDRFHFSKG